MTLHLEGNKAFIGNREFPLSMLSPPLKDGSKYVIEATGNLANQHKTTISPSDLHGVLGSMIPAGLDLIIDEAQGKTPWLCFVSFQNLSLGRCIKLCINISYKDWTYRINLIHFAEDLQLSIEHELPTCQSVSVEKDEYGVYICAQFMLNEKDDCYETFSKIDEGIFSIHKQTIARTDARFTTKRKSQDADGSDSGYRWWVRYVVVPLLSGTLGVFLLGYVFSHL